MTLKCYQRSAARLLLASNDDFAFQALGFQLRAALPYVVHSLLLGYEQPQPLSSACYGPPIHGRLDGEDGCCLCLDHRAPYQNARSEASQVRPW